MTILLDYLPDFYRYLQQKVNSKPENRKHVVQNYISWFKYLDALVSSGVLKMSDFTPKVKVDEIIDEFKRTAPMRDKYTGERDVTNFKTTLNHLKGLLELDLLSVEGGGEDEIVRDIISDSKIPETERRQLVMARKGQGAFRQGLFEIWEGCAISGITTAPLLVASHIKPWRVSTNVERLSQYNGLLLLPQYDMLFDKGYISFDDSGKIMISSLIEKNEYHWLSISDDTHLRMCHPDNKKFLEYHRDKVFME